MSKTIAKTFRLPLEIVREIETGAEECNVSQTQYIVTIVTENRLMKLHKSFNDGLKSMENDAAYLKEQKDLAEADFL